MLRLMVASGRARPERLEAAMNELNRMKSDSASTDAGVNARTAPVRESRAVKAISKDVNSDIFALKHSALSHEAARLRRDQAELSNMLHKVSPEQPCPELVGKILELNHQVERIWDEKKFLDRNQTDGPVDPVYDQQVVTRTMTAVESKAELSVKLQQLREKRSKLKKKLDDPKASMPSKTKWGIELAQVDAAIEETGQKRALI